MRENDIFGLHWNSDKCNPLYYWKMRSLRISNAEVWLFIFHFFFFRGGGHRGCILTFHLKVTKAQMLIGQTALCFAANLRSRYLHATSKSFHWIGPASNQSEVKTQSTDFGILWLVESAAIVLQIRYTSSFADYRLITPWMQPRVVSHKLTKFKS